MQTLVNLSCWNGSGFSHYAITSHVLSLWWNTGKAAMNDSSGSTAHDVLYLLVSQDFGFLLQADGLLVLHNILRIPINTAACQIWAIRVYRCGSIDTNA